MSDNLVEDYSRRLVAALSDQLGRRVRAFQRVNLRRPKEGTVWRALMEDGSEVLLSGVVLARAYMAASRDPRPT